MRRRSKQLDLRLPTWGGKRRGAGRKRAPGTRPPVAHRARPRHRAGDPVHVTMRARPDVGSLRGAGVFAAVRAALKAASKPAFRVTQFSVQSDHVHLMVEGDDKATLALGLRGLAIRVARAINRALDRKGSVWADRYHARALATPGEVRQGLVYVLMNFRKHVRHQPWGIDPCSSAPWFQGFRDVSRIRPPPPPPGDPAVVPSETWLGNVGWRRHGLIGIYERPVGSRE